MISDAPVTVNIKNPNVIEPKSKIIESEQIQQLQSAVSGAVNSLEGVAALSMLGGSTGGGMLRTTQALKVFNRYKYIGVIFGDRLDNYLSLVGKMFNDSDDELKQIEYMKILEYGSRGKISKYRVKIDLVKQVGFKLWIYFGSFLV